MTFKALLVDNHYSRAQKCRYEAWMSDDRQHFGWKVIHDDGTEEVITFEPDLDAPIPTITITHPPTINTNNQEKKP